MEYTESKLKKIRKPELIEILKKSGYEVNNKKKVDELKKMILEKKIKIRISQEEFEEGCPNKNERSVSEIDIIINKNSKKIRESKKIIDLSNPQNNKIKYVIVLPYSEPPPKNAKVFTFKFKEDFIAESEYMLWGERFWGIILEKEDKSLYEGLTKYNCSIEGFSSIWCNDIPAHLGVCKWDDTPALEFKQYSGIGLLCHGRAYLVR